MYFVYIPYVRFQSWEKRHDIDKDIPSSWETRPQPDTVSVHFGGGPSSESCPRPPAARLPTVPGGRPGGGVFKCSSLARCRGTCDKAFAGATHTLGRTHTCTHTHTSPNQAKLQPRPGPETHLRSLSFPHPYVLAEHPFRVSQGLQPKSAASCLSLLYQNHISQILECFVVSSAGGGGSP